MVFESITKSLWDMSDKVSEAAWKASWTMSNPLKNVSKTVHKTVIWPKLNILEQSAEHLQWDLLLSAYKNAVDAMVVTLKKSSVHANKVATLKKVFIWSIKQFALNHDVHHSVFLFLQQVQKQYETWLQVIDYVDENVLVHQWRKRTAKEKPVVLAEHQALVRWLKKFYKTTSSLSQAYTLPAPTSIDQAACFTQAKKDLEKNHTVWLDTMADLVWARRALNNLLRRLEKNHKKIHLLTDKHIKALPWEKETFAKEITLLKKENAWLLSQEWARLLTMIEQYESTLDTHYAQERAIIDQYSTWYTTYQSSLFAWQDANKKLTDRYISARKSSSKKEKQLLAAIIKKDLSALASIEATIKQPFTHHQTFLLLHHEQVETHNKRMDMHTHTVSVLYGQLLHIEKDIATKKHVVSAHHTYSYDLSVLLKVSSIYTSFANRYHNKHVTWAQTARNKLLDLKHEDTSLYAPYLKNIQKKAEKYTWRIKTNTDQTRADKRTIQSLKKWVLTLVRLQSVIDEELLWIKEKQKATLIPFYQAILKDIQQSLQAHHKKISGVDDALIWAIKMSEHIIHDKEKTLSLQSSVKLKKELEKAHNDKDAQEWFLDFYHHYMQELKHHIDELQDLYKWYSKMSTSAKKAVKNHEKRLAYLTKKIGKTPLYKALHWQSWLQSPTSIV